MSRSFGATSLTTRSPIFRAPSEISSRPAIMRRLVVLPHPEGPTRTMNSPSWMSRLRSFTAENSPKRFQTCSNVTVAMRALLPGVVAIAGPCISTRAGRAVDGPRTCQPVRVVQILPASNWRGTIRARRVPYRSRSSEWRWLPLVGADVDQRALVERAQRGDHDAFAVLARAVIDRLGRAARLIVRDPDLARDAVQEALISAWRDLPGLRDPDRFDAWVHRLTVRACLRFAKRERRRAIEVELPEIDLGRPDNLEHDVVLRDALDGALRRLDPERRALVVLHLYVGMVLPEAAAAL